MATPIEINNINDNHTINATKLSLCLTSLGITANNSEEVHPINAKIGEALECKTLQGLHLHVQSLPMDLQQRTITWN